MLAPVRYALVGLAVVLVQWLVLGRLAIFGSYPDAVVLFVAWIGLQFGRRVGAAAGFSTGLLMDAVYDTWGVHMLLKTIVGFALGMFTGSDRELVTVQPRQALLGGLVVALIHNGLLVALLAIQTRSATASMIFTLWFGSAIYTAVVAVVGALFSTR